MKKVDKIKFILEVLDKNYPKTPIPLKHKNIFELLIAVLLSAQCTDKRVNLVTPGLFKLANNPKRMASLSHITSSLEMVEFLAQELGNIRY